MPMPSLGPSFPVHFSEGPENSLLHLSLPEARVTLAGGVAHLWRSSEKCNLFL